MNSSCLTTNSLFSTGGALVLGDSIVGDDVDSSITSECSSPMNSVIPEGLVKRCLLLRVLGRDFISTTTGLWEFINGFSYYTQPYYTTLLRQAHGTIARHE